KQDVEAMLDASLHAVYLDPSDYYAYWGLGSACLASSEMFRAALQRAVEVDPLYAWGFVGLAMTAASRGDLEAAIGFLDQASGIEPGMTQAQLLRCTYLA